ncbi:ABC transporter ATP-binding protein, partial [Eubacterium callanderi]
LDRLNSVSREFLTSIRVVKAFGREDYETGRFGTAAEELAASGISATRVTAVFGPLINLTVNIGIVVLLWLGGTGGHQDVGKLMASVNYMTQVLFALSMVSNILNTMVRATASAERVQEVLSEKAAMCEPEIPTAEKPDGRVAFENVSFSYIHSPEKSLDNVSFCVESGQVLGIIGATGSGKSTLVSLIPRFYDVTGGRVLVGGRDVRSQKTSQHREAIGMVPQKSLLFSGTIRDNLKWGDPEADDKALDAAAHAACADEFINGFSKGYDTVLGQGGVNLSGGQKQRLSIARALIRHPAILVMDDSTSALDATTEAAVMTRIREYARGTTVILISQRIASVMRADKILCMDEGRVSGFGTHEALMAESPVYREIYKSQIGDDEHASR